MDTLTLIAPGLSYQDCQTPEGLKQLDQHFLTYLQAEDATLHQQLLLYRKKADSFSPIETSECLIACGKVLDQFLIDVFGIEKEARHAKEDIQSHDIIALFKKHFIQQKVKRRLHKDEHLPSFETLDHWLEQQIDSSRDKEIAIAHFGMTLLTDETAHQEAIEQLAAWCLQALKTPEGQRIIKQWSLLHLPEKLDYEALIPLETAPNDPHQRTQLPCEHHRQRDGFSLTDTRMTQRQVHSEIHYCVYCHEKDGDFCSKGFPVDKKDRSQGFRKNPLDITLAGCPLDEKISEMHTLKRDGYTIGALAMIMVDNPMCPITGHRICNDCMKACIYQKQTPVNIPEIETRVLTDTLNLPWGVEIYDLLTRWNPLRHTQWVTKPYNGLKVMIAGQGPAGFTLAHHLLQEGFAVVGFDGLKIEPLPEKYITSPIKHFDDIKESLDDRLIAGFGGVAEYGITVRWDKNFLKLIYITLMRRPHYQVFGNVRFGGTVTVEDAWEMGFDHMVVAVGAGLPRALPIPGSLAPGMRQANDFLMALQLTGAAKKNNLANLQLRLPAVIIGGGLTGVDTATEAQAYYLRQVEKILTRYETLSTHMSDADIRNALDIASSEILDEFLLHGRAIREERTRAEKANEAPDFIKLIRQWGGVTIVYRKRIQDSPAYVNNHEELKKALEEGIYYAECLEPKEVRVNQHGHTETLVCRKCYRDEDSAWQTLEEEVTLPARAILVATGASLNIAYAFEHKDTFERNGMQYQRFEYKDGTLAVAPAVEHIKSPNLGPFTSYQKEGHYVTFIGDTHPVSHGNVVKAVASGMKTYPHIVNLLKDKVREGDLKEYQSFRDAMTDAFSTTITKIEHKHPHIIELTVRAPQALKHYRAGQFYRIQNYETTATRVNDTLLQTEGLAMLATHVNRDTHEITFMVAERGASSRMVSTFKEGDPIALMGPTGVRSKVSEYQETILLIGDLFSLAQVRAYGEALKASGDKIVYLGRFDGANDIYCKEAIEAIADMIIWVTPKGEPLPTSREQDMSFTGDAIDILIDYAKETLKQTPLIACKDIDRIQIIGDADFLKRFQEARCHSLKPYLVKQPKVFGSVYGPMQCMLKGVCAQCLQWQIDPETGHRTKAVYACSWQDQPLELIDFDNLLERQSQNKLQEHISNLWLDTLLIK